MWRVIFSIFVATTLVGATPSDEEEKIDTLQHYADQSLFSGPQNEEAPRQEALQHMGRYVNVPMPVVSGALSWKFSTLLSPGVHSGGKWR